MGDRTLWCQDVTGGGGETDDALTRGVGGIGGGGARCARAVFVDDSIAELLDPEVAAIEGLSRVYFSRQKRDG